MRRVSCVRTRPAVRTRRFFRRPSVRFRDRHDGVVARIRLLVVHEEFRKAFRIEMDFGDDGPVHAREVC